MNNDQGFYYAVGTIFLSGACGVYTNSSALGCMVFGALVIVGVLISVFKTRGNKNEPL